MIECTGVVYDDRDWNHDKPHLNFCRCPNCKGFLPQDFPSDKPFICKKCKSELMVFPEVDEVTGEEFIIYDNGPNGTELGGGGIMIHRGGP